MDRLSPALRPIGRPAGFQRWRSLLFLHWQVEAEALRPLVPPALSIDTFEGRAYLGVVPFTMRDVSLWWSPSVPGISNFHELNVRTYVHRDGQEPGVWFFSLDAAKLLVVLTARARWHLPYHFAQMRLDISGQEIRYRSRRHRSTDSSATLDARYRIGAQLGVAEPGTLEHFLTERYLLYVNAGRRGLLNGRVHHRPYPLHQVELLDLSETVTQAAGLPAPKSAPHTLYSPGVDADIFRLSPQPMTSFETP